MCALKISQERDADERVRECPTCDRGEVKELRCQKIENGHAIIVQG